MTDRRESLFGSRRRTQVLELIALLQETYPREIAKLLDAQLKSVQLIVDNLEEANVITSLYSGQERRVSLNRRYFAYQELRDLLIQMGQRDQEVMEAAQSLRRRPRTKGKPI